jgi:acyl carrier protein
MPMSELNGKNNDRIWGSKTSRNEVEKRITDMIRQLALDVGHRLGTIPATSALGRDLGIDSIDVLNLMVQLEDIYKCPLAFEDIKSAEVGDLLVEELVSFVFESVRQQRRGAEQRGPNM